MNKYEEKTQYYLKGYTVYLTKQVSKVLGVSELYVETDVRLSFDQTRELYYVPYYVNGELLNTYELSKEAVLAIEYHHGKEEIKNTVRWSDSEMSIKLDSSPTGGGSIISHSADGIKISMK